MIFTILFDILIMFILNMMKWCTYISIFLQIRMIHFKIHVQHACKYMYNTMTVETFS